MDRRQFLLAGTASGALLFARRTPALAQALGPDGQGALRASRLVPGQQLVHADLHNHSLFSDGDGDPEQAFQSMRDNGLDVAALTDHASISYGLPASPCMGEGTCQGLAGINETTWARTAELADAAQHDGFVALRGFEWSSPTLGHMNVWFSERWIDPLHTGAVSTGQTALSFRHDDALGQAYPPLPASGYERLEGIIEEYAATGASMAGFYQWLKTDPGAQGGLDGIAGFNHPGREHDRFSDFAVDPGLLDRVVSIEVFNRSEDYLFEGLDQGRPSPISQCLDAGWRTGLLGVSDEHGQTWGGTPQKGRAGVWVPELSRAGVRAAMEARRFFATVVGGLRLDATLDGVPMGGDLPRRSGRSRFQVDIAAGPEWAGRPLSVQVLRPAGRLPGVAHVEEVRVPAAGEPVVSFETDLRLDPDHRWVLLRVSDPSRPLDRRAVAPYDQFGGAIAYASPWFVAAEPGAVVPEVGSPVLLGVAAAGALGAAVVAGRRRSRPDHDHHDHDHHDHDHDHHDHDHDHDHGAHA